MKMTYNKLKELLTAGCAVHWTEKNTYKAILAFKLENDRLYEYYINLTHMEPITRISQYSNFEEYQYGTWKVDWTLAVNRSIEELE